MPEKQIPVAIHARVSSSGQNPERQILDLEAFAKKQGWNVVETVGEMISGKKTKRVATEKLVRMARGNKIVKVLTHEATRMGRDANDLFQTVESLAENKVSLYDYQMKMETLDDDGRKTLYAMIILRLLGGLAERESENLSYRIKSGQAVARAKGRVPGRPQAETFKKENKIIEELGNGSSIRKTAEKLNLSPATVLKAKKKHENRDNGGIQLSMEAFSSAKKSKILTTRTS